MASKIKVPTPAGEVEAEPIDFEPIKEAWNEYRLADGSTLRVRIVVNDVFLTGGTTQDGDPEVVVRSTTLVNYRGKPDGGRRTH